MALAEARAALHRTANRCLVQEDAKRAPKLAYCSSIPTNSKQANAFSNASVGQDVPSAVSIPFNLNPSFPNLSFPNLSPNSKWWLDVQSNYQKCSVDEQFSSLEASMATGEFVEFGVKEGVRELKVEDLFPKVPKSANEPCFDPNSSWIGAGRNAPWWRTADSDELASLVAQRSLDYIENCDLPMPQTTHVKGHYSNCLNTVSSPTSENACQKLSVLAGDQSASIIGKPLSDFPTDETITNLHGFENDASKAQLMEALCHSQTRAREAEKAAKQAYAEKEHVVKLVFRQASQLFAYKQWLHLLQLESIYLEFLNNSNHSVKPQRTTKHTYSRPAPQFHSQYEANKYAVAFAIGLGLAGAGFLLGWTIASMFPSW